MLHRIQQGACISCALLCLLVRQAATAAENCLPERFDDTVVVEHIYDGDTVRLKGGRRVRIIGFDTPEIYYDRSEAEPFALDAKEALSELVGQGGGRLRLIYDRERRDHYGRELAHAFTAAEPADSIATALLGQGLAIALTIPPNDLFIECYRAAESGARAAELGLWFLADKQPVASTLLPPAAEGFRIISGRIERIGDSQPSIWLTLEGGVALRIDRVDLVNFPSGFDPQEMVGRVVTARGVIYRQSYEARLRIRHPADLIVEE